MERTTKLEEIESLFGENFLGPDQLLSIKEKFELRIPEKIPQIPFDIDTLKRIKNEYLLILGVSRLEDNTPLTIFNLRNKFGVNPDLSEPCFYNQDWYLNETFVKKNLDNRWYLIRKHIINESRAKTPQQFSTNYILPSATLCTYTFFVNYFINNKFLWENEFVWCYDLDHNKDRIYVGRYCDPDGINKNGFEIHRHLSIKNWHGLINCIE